MAGNYPDVPSNRLAYDKDGSAAFYYDNAGVVSVQSEAWMETLNNETQHNQWSYAGNPSNGRWFGLVFPELRDLYGHFFAGSSNAFAGYYWSANTTTGLDGTWSSVGGGIHAGSVNPAYRTSIASIALNGVKAIRVGGSNSGTTQFTGMVWHLYGTKTAAATPNRVAIWHPTLDQQVSGSYFDWGDAQRSSTADLPFRVKNLSPTLTANNIAMSYSSLTDTSPSFAAQHYFSDDGLVFTGTYNITSLTPGQISPILTCRRVTPSNATLSVWATRMNAVPGSWT